MENKGNIVELTTIDGIFQGRVKLMDEKQCRLLLEKVCRINEDGTKKLFKGAMNFFKDDIIKIKIISDATEHVEEDIGHIEPKDWKLSVSKRFDNHWHLANLVDVNEENVVFGVKAMRLDLPGVNESTMSEADIREVMFQHLNLTEDNFRLVEHESQLDEVMVHFNKESTVGLSTAGVNLGRNGSLCWLQVASKNSVAVLDMIALIKDDKLPEQLKDLLESPFTEKVIHDCRFLSDYLHHKFGAKLVNIFDTQVADIIVYRRLYEGDLPLFTNSLHALLSMHLSLRPEDISVQRFREESFESDQKVWARRPITLEILDALLKNVKYLLQLRQALMRRMMGEFINGVDMYLSAHRDEKETTPMIKAINQVPDSMKNLRKRNLMMAKALYGLDAHKTPDGLFRYNCVGSLDPELEYCRDSVSFMSRRGTNGPLRGTARRRIQTPPDVTSSGNATPGGARCTSDIRDYPLIPSSSSDGAGITTHDLDPAEGQRETPIPNEQQHKADPSGLAEVLGVDLEGQFAEMDVSGSPAAKPNTGAGDTDPDVFSKDQAEQLMTGRPGVGEITYCAAGTENSSGRLSTKLQQKLAVIQQSLSENEEEPRQQPINTSKQPINTSKQPINTSKDNDFDSIPHHTTYRQVEELSHSVQRRHPIVAGQSGGRQAALLRRLRGEEEARPSVTPTQLDSQGDSPSSPGSDPDKDTSLRRRGMAGVYDDLPREKLVGKGRGAVYQLLRDHLK